MKQDFLDRMKEMLNDEWKLYSSRRIGDCVSIH